jgi:hypothetical protein
MLGNIPPSLDGGNAIRNSRVPSYGGVGSQGASSSGTYVRNIPPSFDGGNAWIREPRRQEHMLGTYLPKAWTEEIVEVDS